MYPALFWLVPCDFVNTCLIFLPLSDTDWWKNRKFKIITIFASFGPFGASKWLVGAPASFFLDCSMICMPLPGHWINLSQIYSRNQENKDYSHFCLFGSLWGLYMGPWGPQHHFSWIVLQSASIHFSYETTARPLTQSVSNFFKKLGK